VSFLTGRVVLGVWEQRPKSLGAELPTAENLRKEPIKPSDF